MAGNGSDRLARERLGVQLSAEKDKALLELGKLARAKVAAGQITDRELAAAAEDVGRWDRALRKNLAETADADGVEAAAEPASSGPFSAFGEHISFRSRFRRLARLSAWRDTASTIVKHGLLGALLSIVLLAAIGQALSMGANRLLETAVTEAGQTVADNVRERAETARTSLAANRIDWPAFVPEQEIGNFIRDKLPDLSRLQERLPAGWQEANLPTLFEAPRIILLLNNVPAELSLSVNIAPPGGRVESEAAVAGGATFGLGLYAFLLVPIVALLFGSYMAARRMKLASLRAAAGLSLTIGVVYALFLYLLTQVSDLSTGGALARGLVGAELIFAFSATQALLHGLTLGTLCGLAGCGFRLGIRKTIAALRFRVPCGRAIGLAALVACAGIGIGLLYAGIVLFAKGALTPVALALLPQLAIGLWNVAQGNSLHLSDFAADGGSAVRVSLLGGIGGSEAADTFGADWNLFIYLFALVPVVLLALAGIKLRNTNRSGETTGDGNARDIADKPGNGAIAFSFAYAVLMTAIVLLTNVSATAYGRIGPLSIGSFALEAGFSPTGTFIVCFIAACLLSQLGIRMRRLRLFARAGRRSSASA